MNYTTLNISHREITIKKKRLEYIDTCKIYDSRLEDPQKTMNDVDYKTYKQIAVDIPRTMPEFKVFSYDKIRKLMLRVLFIWSMRHPASGYVQGFNDLISPFVAVFLIDQINNYRNKNKLNNVTNDSSLNEKKNEKKNEKTIEKMNEKTIEKTIDKQNLQNDQKSIETKEVDLYALDFSEDFMAENGITEDVLESMEADIYWCFSKMMDKIQSNYTNNQPGLQKMMSKLEEIIKLLDPELVKHLQLNEVSFIQFSFRWMNCYLMREFSLKLIIRLWDTYFSEENAFNNFHLFVCACFLLNFGDKIKKLDFSNTILFLQNLPTDLWTISDLEVLLAKSYQASVMYGNCSFLK